jgi:hypothetical protein
LEDFINLKVSQADFSKFSNTSDLSEESPL